jgi:hypothetical protein
MVVSALHFQRGRMLFTYSSPQSSKSRLVVRAPRLPFASLRDVDASTFYDCLDGSGPVDVLKDRLPRFGKVARSFGAVYILLF